MTEEARPNVLKTRAKPSLEVPWRYIFLGYAFSFLLSGPLPVVITHWLAIMLSSLVLAKFIGIRKAVGFSIGQGLRLIILLGFILYAWQDDVIIDEKDSLKYAWIGTEHVHLIQKSHELRGKTTEKQSLLRKAPFPFCLLATVKFD